MKKNTKMILYATVFMVVGYLAYILAGLPFVIVVALIGLGAPVIINNRKNNEKPTLYIIIKNVLLSIYFFSIVLFLLTMCTNGAADYYERIDPVETHYTAFATEHSLSVFIFYLFFIFAMITLYVKGRDLPPLALSLCIVFMIIGITLNIAIIAQYFNTESGAIVYVRFTEPNTVAYIENMDISKYIWSDIMNKSVGLEDSGLRALTHIHFWCWRNDTAIQACYHIVTVLLSVAMLIKIIKQENELAINRRFKNKYLNAINHIIGKHCFLWALILLMPVFIVITIILILFGQEKDSLLKVWTETTTWTFSQHEHPPYLDHKGHYLCTVAACGHYAVVRPLRLGKRRNRVIVVNRQLLIANAYEEMVSIYFPTFHKIIRKIYDKCGYPISKNITNKYISDIVYILMKPLEYFFVINLYLFVTNPEDLINKQYRLDTE